MQLDAAGQACDPTIDMPQQLLAVSQGGTRRIEGGFDAISQWGDAAIDMPHQLLDIYQQGASRGGRAPDQ